MRFGLMVPLSALMLLAGCGGDAADKAAGAAGGEAATTAEKGALAREMANAPRLQPGQYSVAMEMVRFDVPGMPPEQAQMMQQMMAGVSAQQQSHCVTQAESEQSLQDMYRRLGEGNCTMDNFDVSGNRMTGQMTCSGGDNRTSRISITGEMGTTSSDTRMVMALTDPGMPQGNAEMEMRVRMTRTGDCIAGAAGQQEGAAQ
jgi:hypothetical protein